MSNNPNEITISIGAKGAGVPISSLTTLLINLKWILTSATQQLSQGRSATVKWEIIGAKMSSPLALTLSAVTENETLPKRAIRTTMNNVRKISARPVMPKTMTDKDLECVNTMVTVLTKDGVDSVVMESPGIEAVALTEHIIANVKEIRRQYTHRIASFRGKLYNINTHGRNDFEIYDMVTNKKITCNFAPHEYARAGLFLKRRVAVYGKAKYGPNGDLISVDVADFDAIPESAQRITELKKISVPDGFDSVKFIRDIRDGNS